LRAGFMLISRRGARGFTRNAIRAERNHAVRVRAENLP
jgi:hypothetical protein